MKLDERSMFPGAQKAKRRCSASVGVGYASITTAERPPEALSSSVRTFIVRHTEHPPIAKML